MPKSVQTMSTAADCDATSKTATDKKRMLWNLVLVFVHKPNPAVSAKAAKRKTDLMVRSDWRSLIDNIFTPLSYPTFNAEYEAN